MLPASVTILRPPSLPDRFAAPVLFDACQDLPGDPQYAITQGVATYTIVYRAGDEAVVFLMNGGRGSWGNTPGPPTSIDRITVRGVDASLYTLAAHVAGSQSLPPFYALSWREAGASYEIKANSVTLRPPDLVALAEGLASVR